MSYKYTSHTAEFLGYEKQSVRAALEVCGGIAEGYAKGLCPVQTGNLRNSITHKPAGDTAMAVGTNVEYAPFVELGHHQTPGRYVPAIGKRLVASFVSGKAFVRPAVENHESEYEGIIKSSMSV